MFSTNFLQTTFSQDTFWWLPLFIEKETYSFVINYLYLLFYQYFFTLILQFILSKPVAFRVYLLLTCKEFLKTFIAIAGLGITKFYHFVQVLNYVVNIIKKDYRKIPLEFPNFFCFFVSETNSRISLLSRQNIRQKSKITL